ncbi:hypothetical protein [Yeosuana marina]|uniref:hypothetical protein n=1 Tax=Yeosuana marina TaxID=1565536 RepID=UPI00141DD210|nr:hypothetical protein [Yeosuana marina]
MKNLLVYYFQILLPIPLLFLSVKSNNSTLFITLLVFYYIYRIFTDYYRLLKKDVVKKEAFLFFFIPIWRIKFFKELYFEK